MNIMHLILDYEWSDECIGLTMMCFFSLPTSGAVKMLRFLFEHIFLQEITSSYYVEKLKVKYYK